MSSNFGLTPAEFATHPHALIGDVSAICDTLVERREKLGISYVTFSSSAMETAAPVVARLAGT